jgi:hypothetical protein
MRCLVILLLAQLFTVVPVMGQEACSDKPFAVVGSGLAVQRPAAYTAAAAVGLRLPDGTRPDDGRIAAPGDTWTQPNVERLRKLTKGAPGVLVWQEAGKADCAQTVTFAAGSSVTPTPTPAPAPAPGTTPAPTPTPAPADAQPAPQPPRTDIVTRRRTGFGENDCEQAGESWLSRLGRSTPDRPRDKFTVLLFHEDGALCYAPNHRPTQGNPIHVGVFAGDITPWTRARITFQPCSLEPTAPNVLVQGRLPSLAQLEAEDWALFEFPARQCWDSTVVIRVEGNGRELSHTLTQATLYRATVHLGTVFTENHDTTFGLRPESETVNRVFAEGPVDKGPEYVAALVFYSLLRYIPPLGGGLAYQGRDPVRDTGFADRLGGVIGIGLRNPLERFIAGFSFEVAAGVNLLAVWDWAETSTLAGIEEGDIFPGEVEEIPTLKEWRQKFVIGVSMDLVYAANAFRR